MVPSPLPTSYRRHPVRSSVWFCLGQLQLPLQTPSNLTPNVSILIRLGWSTDTKMVCVCLGWGGWGQGNLSGGGERSPYSSCRWQGAEILRGEGRRGFERRRDGSGARVRKETGEWALEWGGAGGVRGDESSKSSGGRLHWLGRALDSSFPGEMGRGRERGTNGVRLWWERAVRKRRTPGDWPREERSRAAINKGTRYVSHHTLFVRRCYLLLWFLTFLLLKPHPITSHVAVELLSQMN